MAPDQLIPSEHAWLRYRERWRPELSADQACDEFHAQCREAVFVEFDGDFIYRLPVGALVPVAPDGTVRTTFPRDAKPRPKRVVHRNRVRR